MALITCTECSAEVSDRASACPKCGGPLTPAAPPTPEQVRARELLAKGGSIPAVAKATGLPMREVTSMRAEMKFVGIKRQAAKQEQVAVWWDKVFLVICVSGAISGIINKDTFWTAVCAVGAAFCLINTIAAAMKTKR